MGVNIGRQQIWDYFQYVDMIVDLFGAEKLLKSYRVIKGDAVVSGLCQLLQG